jgi:hypothetical protein
MAVFGILAIVHDSSLSRVGAGLWGGAVAMATGVVGVLAGLRSCYSVTESSPSRLAVTAFLALCLISLAVGNLVVVLAVIGLVRDGQTADVRAIEEVKARNSITVAHYRVHKSPPVGLTCRHLYPGRTLTHYLRSILMLSSLLRLSSPR